MLEERIINLEIKFSHQDDFLNELNKIVSKQQTIIERLEKELLELRGEMSLEDTGSLKPPHY